MNATKPDGRSRRAVQKRQARRSDILNAAVHLFSSRGFHATSISDLIEEAGISRGTFYLYFDSKEALFLDLMDLFAKHIMDVVEVVDPAGPNPVEKIYQNVRRIVDVVFDNRELAVIVFRETFGLDSGIDQKLNKLYGFLREMVEGALTKGASWGIIRHVNEQVVTTALIGAIKEVFYHHLVVEPNPIPDRETFTTSLFEFSTKGLLSA
jgi:AcrR family transcriptional regulator